MSTSGITLQSMLALLVGALAVSGVALSAVMINEVEINPPVNQPKWVELYNDGSQAVDISGWTVNMIDTPWEGPMVVPAGTQIEPDGYYVQEGDKRWEERSNVTVELTDAAGNMVDRTARLGDARSNSFTWGRFPNGKNTGTGGDWAFMMSSKGGPNGGSLSSR
jgi:hypothetical protein